MANITKIKRTYAKLLSNIEILLDEGRKKASYTVNSILVNTYWEIGRHIVEYEQLGNKRANYGDELLMNLSQDLKQKYRKGFSRSNLQYMRLLYLEYQKYQTLSGKLSWSHYIELLGIDDKLERNFYEKQCINEHWSIRELQRQISSSLFYRIALSKDKKGVINLSKKGQIIQEPKDLMRDPYILEFLNLHEEQKYSEKHIEQKLIDYMQSFLLELGKGFAFVKRQHRITLDNRHFYVDLVFYNKILKCFVLIDLKIGEVTHQDIGQMNMYINYFKHQENSKDDEEPVGIVLGTENTNKRKTIVKYALGGITNHLFVSKYKLVLPDKKELENKLKEILKE